MLEPGPLSVFQTAGLPYAREAYGNGAEDGPRAHDARYIAWVAVRRPFMRGFKVSFTGSREFQSGTKFVEKLRTTGRDSAKVEGDNRDASGTYNASALRDAVSPGPKRFVVDYDMAEV